MFITLPVFQLRMLPLPPLLNDVARANILLMVSTLDTSQSPMSWLKLSATQNIKNMLVTLPVFHPLRSLLKDVAPLNIDSIVVTPETSQDTMFWLNSPAPENMRFMVVTLETFQLLRF